MKYLVSAFLVFLVMCLPAFGQIDADRLQSYVDNDKNCTDFDSQLKAQSHFNALQIIVGDPNADPHGLDRDGNGYACEGLTYMRVLEYGEYAIRTKEIVDSVICPPIGVAGWISLYDWSQKMLNAPLEQINYLMTEKERECIDTIFEIYDNAVPTNRQF